MPTVRQAIRELLQEQALSALELSRRLSLSEKEIYHHLEHLARAAGPGYRFQIIPARCRKCGYIFSKRERLTPPSRCPLCRYQSLTRPRFALVRIKD